VAVVARLTPEASALVVWELEREKDELAARVLTLAAALEDAGLVVPDAEASLLLHFRLLQATVDRAAWFLKGQATREELEEAVAASFAAVPVCRAGDHAVAA
jgi:hypothetical protein